MPGGAREKIDVRVAERVAKGKKEEEKKEKPSDQTQSSQRDIQVPGGAPSGVDVSGAVVGYVGSTGRSSGPHIHIETGDGYSGNVYDLNTATRNGVIYPSLDPSIFEVRFPNQDIRGKVTAF